MRKIFIATPSIDGNVKARYAWSMFITAKMLTRYNFDVSVLHPGIATSQSFADVDLMRFFNGSDICNARSRAAHQFRTQTDGDSLMFIDADTVWTQEALVGVINESAKRDIVGASYPRKDIDWGGVKSAVERGLPPQWGAYDYVYKADRLDGDDLDGQCVPVDALGLGFTCISRQALETMTEAMKEEHTYYDQDLKEDVVCIFDLWRDAKTKQRLQEDYSFFHRWRQLDPSNKVWMYLGKGAPVSHEGSFLFEGHSGGMLGG